MAIEKTKTKVKEKGAFSKVQNKKPRIEYTEPIRPTEPEVVNVGKNQLFPQTKQIVRIEKMDMPLATADEAKKMWDQYQQLFNALIKQEDVVEIKGRKMVKKSGINKIARFFGYNCEIVRTYKEDCETAQGVPYFVWRVWAKAIAPNGRFRVSGAACASNERDFAHLEHDVMAMAETRAKKRAIEELAGMGESELFESGAVNKQPPQGGQVDQKNEQVEAVNKIQNLLNLIFPEETETDNQGRLDLLYKSLGTNSIDEIRNMAVADLLTGYVSIMDLAVEADRAKYTTTKDGKKKFVIAKAKIKPARVVVK